MFIDKTDLPTVIYNYQLEEITEGDDSIITQNCAAAIEEVRSYLSNSYDCDLIFAATGIDRNPLLLEFAKNMALWYIIRLSNVDIIYNQAKERYDRAIKWLTAVNAGEVSPNLPRLTAPDGTVATKIHVFSNRKFGHGNK